MGFSWIFLEINHPAIGGTPKSYGNLHILGGETSMVQPCSANSMASLQFISSWLSVKSINIYIYISIYELNSPFISIYIH